MQNSKHGMKGDLRNDLINVTPNAEQILSFKLLEKTHFQETFHWINMYKNIRIAHTLVWWQSH